MARPAAAAAWRLLLPLLAGRCALGGGVPSVQWTNGYSNKNCEAHPHKVVETRDGGFLLVGDSVCWDGSSTAKRLIFVVKTDAQGREQWSTRVGDVHYNYGKGGIELEDGTFLVVGAVSRASSVNPKNFTEHRALIRLSAGGDILRTTLLENALEKEGRLDGVMCADRGREPGTVVITGYKGSVEQYPDNPMFLIYGGQAYGMELSFGPPTADPEVLFEAPLAGDGWDAVQGMRVRFDQDGGRYIVSALAVSPRAPGVPQFSLFAIDAGTGAVLWSRFLPAQNAKGAGVMSHPYAMDVAAGGAGYVIAGHAFPCFGESTCEPHGRLVKVSPSGDLEWDARFRMNGTDMNTECYGVTALADGGFAVACGTGVEPEDHPHDPPAAKTWMVLVHKADRLGAAVWQQNFTSTARLENNAAEDIFATRDGGLAVAVDSQSFGPPHTGGNFGLMKLAPDGAAAAAAAAGAAAAAEVLV